MRRRFLATLATLSLPATLLLGAPPAAAVDDDCGDFQYQEDAQTVFDRYVQSDPHRLDVDGDGDGIACESLPGRPGTPRPAHAPTPAPQVAPERLPTRTSLHGHDFSGDANPDVLATDSSGRLFLYRGTDRGGFGTRTQIGHGWTARDMLMHAGDWDGDGTRDLIARSPSDGALWLYRGDGRGGFSGSSVIGRGWGAFTTLLAPGDWDDDRDPDLIALRADGSMYLYRGDGRGGFDGPYPRIGHGWNTRDALTTAGDWNGDGANDLIARDPSDGRLWLYAGNGRGGFDSTTSIGVGWGHFNALLGPGDWNGDGTADLLARTPRGDLYLYGGNGRGRFASPYPEIGRGWATLTLTGSALPQQPSASQPSSTQPPAPPPSPPRKGTARALLEDLETAPETTEAYDRDALFGGWIDADGDGCDTRAEVLQRWTMTTPTYSSGCTVATGSWGSYLDGARWTDASELGIDHLVGLEEAWASGIAAQGWSAARRRAYANDLGYTYSLMPVTDDVEHSRSHGDPAEWLPPLESVHCMYATQWVAVKHRWELTVDAAERAALDDLLAAPCGDEPISAPPRP